ncbi:RNA polymerase II degradation factor 1, partial [Aplysia californica]|uniref:RNA polymerase II degradation factor 1 n=1 Tax=Aplysia californica TaxID=6500 RepID=A0ABM1VRR8_APLCA
MSSVDFVPIPSEDRTLIQSQPTPQSQLQQQPAPPSLPQQQQQHQPGSPLRQCSAPAEFGSLEAPRKRDELEDEDDPGYTNHQDVNSHQQQQRKVRHKRLTLKERGTSIPPPMNSSAKHQDVPLSPTLSTSSSSSESGQIHPHRSDIPTIFESSGDGAGGGALGRHAYRQTRPHSMPDHLLRVVEQEDDLSDWESPVEVDLANPPARKNTQSSWRKIR